MPSSVRLSDTELIFLVLLGYYLFECGCWLPRAAVCFVSGWRSWRPLRGGFLENNRGGLVITALRPGGSSFVTLDPLLDDRVRRRLAALEAESDKARSDGMDALVSELTDVAAIRARFELFQGATGLLGTLGTLLFLLTFGFGAYLYYTATPGAPNRLWIYLGLVAVYWFSTIYAFIRAHRRLYPDDKSDRRKRAMMMCCSPAAAMRGVDTLSRPLFAGRHPVAVAAVVCGKQALAELAGSMLRELKFQTHSPNVAEGQPHSQVDREFQDRLCRRLTATVIDAGIPESEIFAPPPADSDAVAYCPRCHRQYVAARDTCDQCPGIAVVSFAQR